MKIMLIDSPQHPVRLAFTQNLFEMGSIDGGEPAYSVTAIFPKDHPAVPQILAAEKQEAKNKFGDKADTLMKQWEAAGGRGPKGQLALKDGDGKAEYAGFEGNYYLSMRSKTRPTVIDRSRQPLTQGDGVVYSGCHANVSFELWPQSNGYGKRLNNQVLGVQFTRDGDSFGGGATPAKPDDFADLSADGDGSGGGLLD